MKKKRLLILGSTGSIGEQALAVVSQHLDKFEIVGISANKNISLLRKQISKFRPPLAAIGSQSHGQTLQENFPKTKIFSGPNNLINLITSSKADIALVALVGAIAIDPTLKAIDCHMDIAIATKEVLVAAGELINKAVAKSKVRILPVDSEHSAISQCIGTTNTSKIKKIILTASGGPFLNLPLNKFDSITPEKALKHPNWEMGAKISIDSATMINKALEVIEAFWLFNIPIDNIEVVIHPQSIIHSMVEFIDGSVIAQMGIPDMRLPIQYALSLANRWPANFSQMDFQKKQRIDFLPVDTKRFPGLALAYDAIKKGQSMQIVLNAANEVAVQLFLENKISFKDIVNNIEKVMKLHSSQKISNIDDIKQVDSWARKKTLELA